MSEPTGPRAYDEHEYGVWRDGYRRGVEDAQQGRIDLTARPGLLIWAMVAMLAVALIVLKS